MKRQTLKKLAWYAKQAKIPAGDVRAVYEDWYGTKAAACEAIRAKAKCTQKAASARYDAAKEVVRQIRADESRGDRRRQKAKLPEPAPIGRRKSRVIRRLLGDLPGGYYSGDTDWRVVACPRDEVTGFTETCEGEGYSRRCTWKKTDARHHLYVCLGDLLAARRTPVPAEIDGALVIRAQQVRDLVWQITTLETVGKSVACRQRYVAQQYGGYWHMAKTERGAVIARNRGNRASAVEVVKVNASLCRSWGWCSEGIRRWCRKHGITRNLQQRMRRGARSAALARLIQRHGGPADSYELRLLEAAGVLKE